MSATSGPTDPTLRDDDPASGAWRQVRVRPAVATDHEAIGRLTLTSYLEGGHLAEDDGYAQTLTDVAARVALAEVLVGEVVAGHGPAVAGSVVITVAGSAMAETAREGELEFRMLAVDPAFQRRGVARALVRAVIERAERMVGVDAVVLTTMATMAGAHRLYASEGFIRAPERDWFLSDVEADDSGQGKGPFPVYRRPV